MTVLFLTPRYPWPLIGGDRIKAYHLLRHLATRHRVILVTFSHGVNATAEQLSAIRTLGIEVHSVRLSPFYAALGALRTFWTQQPIEVAFYNRPAFAKAVNDVLDSTRIDLAVSFFARTAEYIRNRPDLRKILVAEDCRVEYQTRSMQASSSWLQRAVRWWEILKLRRHERDVVRDFDVVTYVSNEDVAAMHALLPSNHYAIVTNGVDLRRFSFHGQQEHRSGVLFIGKLDVHANDLMVDSIINNIMPQVWQTQPEVILTIVGGEPPKKLKKLKGNVVLTGSVPDGVPYLHDAAVFLHPHSGGSGIQNKVLEAMAAGCAVVTTTTGLQGIDAQHGVHCLVASSSEDAAAHVTRLLSNPDERALLTTNARKLMEDTHSWELVNDQIDNVIQSVSDTTDLPRTHLRAGLLLDRDGIINERIADGYVRTPGEFHLCADIVPILRYANDHGMPVAVITNQQGVGKGLMSAADLAAVHQHMLDVMKTQRVPEPDGIYVCTSLHAENDQRRKPNPGMVLEALRDLNLEPSMTWFIGDSESDAEAGRRAGVRTMLVGPFPPHTADVVVPDLRTALEAVKSALEI